MTEWKSQNDWLRIFGIKFKAMTGKPVIELRSHAILLFSSSVVPRQLLSTPCLRVLCPHEMGIALLLEG